jgi:hypothetical protein
MSVSILLMRGFIPRTASGTPAEEIAKTCVSLTAPNIVDVVMPLLGIFGFLGFLFFFGSLWSALHRAEGDDGWLSAAAFGGGVASLVTLLGGGVGAIAAHRNACSGIDPQLWQMLHNMGSASFFLSFFPLIILLVASAIVAIRFGALPRWLGWMSLLVAVSLLIGGTVGTTSTRDDAGLPFLLFELWTVITSIVLMRRESCSLSTVSATLTSRANEAT